jgi:hypothetical protein
MRWRSFDCMSLRYFSIGSGSLARGRVILLFPTLLGYLVKNVVELVNVQCPFDNRRSFADDLEEYSRKIARCLLQGLLSGHALSVIRITYMLLGRFLPVHQAYGVRVFRVKWYELDVALR